MFDIEGAGPSESARKVRERSSVLLWLLVITSVLFFPPLGLASLYLMVTVSFLRDSYVWYICIICAENLIQPRHVLKFDPSQQVWCGRTSDNV